MKITVLESSPNKNGASNTLAEFFIKGARKAGNDVEVLDIAHMNLKYCIGCYFGSSQKRCIQNDDFHLIEESLKDSEIIVYVTPVYYYTMSAPMKIVIDRLHCFSSNLQGMKSLLLATALRVTMWLCSTSEITTLHLQRICDMIIWVQSWRRAVEVRKRYKTVIMGWKLIN